MLFESRATAPGSDAINRLVTKDHHRPGEGLGAARIELRRVIPQIHKALLEHVLSLFFIDQHLAHQGKQRRGKAVIQSTKGRLIATRSPAQQDIVRFVLIGGERWH